jgi:hypothetical protein
VVARFGEDRLEHVDDVAHAHTLGVNDCLPAAAPATAKEIAELKRRHVAFGLSGRIQRAAAARACPAPPESAFHVLLPSSNTRCRGARVKSLMHSTIAEVPAAVVAASA